MLLNFKILDFLTRYQAKRENFIFASRLEAICSPSENIFLRNIQSGQTSVSLLNSNISKMVKDTKMKLSHLKKSFDKLCDTQLVEKF